VVEMEGSFPSFFCPLWQMLDLNQNPDHPLHKPAYVYKRDIPIIYSATINSEEHNPAKDAINL